MSNTCVNKNIDLAALLLRLTVGILFLAHAGLKVFVFTLPGTVAFFESLGLPGFMAYAAIAVETIGGLALIFGFYSRYFSIPLILVLAGAVATVHAKAGFFFTNEGGGWEYLALWIVALIVIILLGDGAYAVKPTKNDTK